MIDEFDVIYLEFLNVVFFVVSEKERVVNLGELIGKIPAGAGAGSGSLTGLKDDRRNKVNPGTQISESFASALQILIAKHLF